MSSLTSGTSRCETSVSFSLLNTPNQFMNSPPADHFGGKTQVVGMPPTSPWSFHLSSAQKNDSGGALPFRITLCFLLTVCWIIAVTALVNFWNWRAAFPLWFRPIFMIGMPVLVGMITFWFWAIHRSRSRGVPRPGEIKSLWLLSILSVICTSSLHQFWPFRPGVLSEWAGSGPMLHYNFIFTAVSLVAVTTLAGLYFRGLRRAASSGLVLVAWTMLVPNCPCPNSFNEPWLRWLGASPLMFFSNSAVLLIAYCGLHGIRPRAAALVIGLINAGVLALGIGHTTGMVW
jgi:hypothetical protein